MKRDWKLFALHAVAAVVNAACIIYFSSHQPVTLGAVTVVIISFTLLPVNVVLAYKNLTPQASSPNS